jgi:penicillin amidase
MQEVLDRWYTPGSNLVYADTGGSIAWSPRALIPVRPNWDGLLPVPGDGRYERDGFRTADELPHVIDPAAGWIATANEYNLPDDGSWPTIPISYEWFASIRAERIAEVLSADSAVTVASAASLQNDYLNVHARETCGLLSDEYFAETDAEWARRLLLAWDNRMTTDSVAAAVFERWVRGPLRRRLYTAALAVLVSGTQRDRALSQVVPAETMVGDLSVDRRLLRGLAAHPTVRRQVLEESLTAAVAECRSELGDDANSWTWGRINRSQLGHTAAGFLEPDLPWRSTRSLPKSGSSETVGLAAPSPATGIEQTGASFRIVIDVGDWNRSIAINTPGQAGDPRSKHYSDLYDRWHADDYFPLLYTPEAIDRNVSESIKVVPIALSVSARG